MADQVNITFAKKSIMGDVINHKKQDSLSIDLPEVDPVTRDVPEHKDIVIITPDVDVVLGSGHVVLAAQPQTFAVSAGQTISVARR